MVGLCDCNNFFVSCERVFNPSLCGRAVVVLSNNDGCVIARSNEAKELGIKMAQPLFQIKHIVTQNKVAIYSSNYKLYGDMSHRVMTTLRNHAPAIEVYSIDEAFIDFDGFDINALTQRGKEMARTVKRNTGIPVSIGIAPTKTLAKIASKLCKKYPKLESCCLMYRSEDIDKVLKNYPIEDVWGIGRRYSKMLKSLGIESAYQFTQCSPEWVKAKMSVVGLQTWRELRGEMCIDFNSIVADRQSISVSRSFSRELTTFDELHRSLSLFTSMAAEKLRRQAGVASQMDVAIMTNRFRDTETFSYDNLKVRFEIPTDSTLELLEQMKRALVSIYHEGMNYKKAGITLSSITRSENLCATLFDTIDRDKHSSLMKTIDTINSNHGRNSIIVASQGTEPILSNREHLSGEYTTNWDEILVVKV